jgi:DNA-binding beta-propeller fold protein YncE
MRTLSFRRALTSALALGLGLSLVLPSSPAAAATLTVVRRYRTSDWQKPSPDPTGIAYFPGGRRFIVVDSEIEEAPHPHWKGVNVWIVGLKGRVLRSFSTLRYSKEPTDVAVGPGGNTLFFSDDSQDEIHIVHKGRDHIWGTKDDLVRSFSTKSFGSRDPMGLAYGAGSLFVTDGDNSAYNPHKVYRIRPGKNHIFNGAPPVGDDIVTSFDTLALGIAQPEDVAFAPLSGRLWIVGQKSKRIVVSTLAGVQTNSWDISPFGVLFPSGIALAPPSNGSKGRHIYVTDAGEDNNAVPLENDGRIFEFALT